jgi:hypothetical protein
MRCVLFGVVAAVLAGSAAMAKDFIVVSSSDPAIRTGQSLDAGSKLPLAQGRAITLMRPGGEIITIKGGPDGATLPGAPASPSGATQFAAFQALFSPPPTGRTFGAQRGFCPGPEALDNIPAIIRSNQAGCKADARKAFQDYLKAHGVEAADADRLYANTMLSAEGSPAS